MNKTTDLYRLVWITDMGNHNSGSKFDMGDSSNSDRLPIQKVDINLPEISKGKLAFVLHNVLTEEECKAYIEKTEEMGYEMAMLNIGRGRQMLATDVRNNSRCIWDSVEEADKLFQRIKSYLPKSWNDRQLISLNERLRCLKYDPGEYFKPHMDGTYMRDNGETSYITIQLYLNEGFSGGSTTFLGQSPSEAVECIPKNRFCVDLSTQHFTRGFSLEERTEVYSEN